jgi:hypothetical protein
MSLIVHRGKGHVSWDAEMRDMLIKYIRSCAKARIPDDPPAGREVRCKPLTVKDGWLFDADIKKPAHKPAPYAKYTGDKKLAFWLPDKAMADAVWEYHGRPWPAPDPTAGQPIEKRFYPPALLRDMIDAPAPKALRWSGGDGTWGGDAANWLAAGKLVAWDGTKRAVFDGVGGAVTLAAGANCVGLELGKGYTLTLGAPEGNRIDLRVRWHAKFAKGATVAVTLTAKDGRRKRGRLHVEGNAQLAGRLVLTATEPLKDGKYLAVGCSGVVTGAFDEVVAPEGYTAEARGGLITLTKKATE